jgi:tricorn protease
MSVISLYNMDENRSWPVTTNWYDSYSPVFSEDGKYLFFTSSREFQANYSRVEWNTSYNISSYVFVLPLAKTTADPVIIKSDEYKGPKEPEKQTAPAKKETKSAEPALKITVDTQGLVERASALPLEPGMYQLLAAFDDELYFATRGEVKKISMKDLEVSPVTKGRPLAYAPKGRKCWSGSRTIYMLSGLPPGNQTRKQTWGMWEL